MQRNGGGRDPFSGFGDPFAGFGGFSGFSGHRSLMSNFFGGRDPLDDPFFTRPFGGMFESAHFGHPGNPFTDAHASGLLEHQAPQLNRQAPQHNRPRGPIIEELNSDDEKGQQEKKDNPRKHSRSSNEPYVEYPDDEAGGRRSKQIQYRNDFSRPSNTYLQPQTHSFSFQSSSVTYGGANGAYYSSSRTRRTGSDGVTLEESKEADTASRQASHQLFRGIHDKGHTVARKLKSDGRVDTMQTLHNLNEEELSGFEEVWKGKARKHLPGWSEGLNLHDDHVTMNFARSGGPGGQNVNKVNTKVDMRFNVKNAYWLSERVRDRILQMEKNRINKDGELVISSTRTRTQKGNIEDALQKLQEIIDAASYVPPPPSEEQVKKIAKLAAVGEQRRLQSKKALSDKKSFRRNRNNWD